MVVSSRLDATRPASTCAHLEPCSRTPSSASAYPIHVVLEAGGILMARAPFQVLVLPFRIVDTSTFEYALFKRSDEPYWQGIAGGGEDAETPLAAARREAFEEAQIPPSTTFF